MKRILLPTDFSKNSINAINYAMDFFKGKNCDFYFLNVQKPSEFVSSDIYTASPVDSTIYSSIAEDNKKKLNKLVAAYSKNYVSESFTFEGIFDFDVFVDSILQTIYAKNIELVVMGTNGATGASEVLFGSNTLKVIRNIQHPVLVIPENYSFSGFNSLLFTLKEEDDIHPDALIPIGEMVERNEVSLQVLQLNTQKQMPKSKILAYFSEINYHHIDNVPTPEAISSFEQLFSVDMHAIIIHPKSFFERVFRGNDTSKLSYESSVPLLVLK